MRRNGIILPAAVVAAILVAAVSAAAWIIGPSDSGATGTAAAIAAIPNSHAVALLQQERKEIVAMSEATRTLTVVAKPKLASPASAASSSSGNSSPGSSTVTTVAAPDPAAAQAIARSMMASFGFPSSEFSCLVDIWNRESGWKYDAENPSSGAYGIPQALPGYKMASAGPDWQTDPATQIRWGLGYIQQVYGNPCAAWNFDVANGGY
jgi:resuscitation-promoting factor RpfB